MFIIFIYKIQYQYPRHSFDKVFQSGQYILYVCASVCMFLPLMVGSETYTNHVVLYGTDELYKGMSLRWVDKPMV